MTLRSVRALHNAGMIGLRAPTALAAGLWARRDGIAAVLSYAVHRHPHHVAVIDDHQMITCAELDRRATAAADRLRGLGLARGERTGVPIGNDIDSVVALLAAARLGLSVWPADGRAPAESIGRLAADHRWSLLVAPTPRPELGDAAHHTPHTHVYRCGDPPHQPDPRSLVMLTGGTTGVSKAAGRGTGISPLWPPFCALLADVGLTTGGTAYLTTPLHHGFGLSALLLGLLLGTTTHLTTRLDRDAVADRIRSAEPAALVAVPTTLQRLLAHDPSALRRVGTIVSGSAPLPPDVAVGIRTSTTARLFHLFGTTEAGLCALATPAMLRDDPGTIGRPIPGVRMRITDGNGAETAPGMPGALQVCSPAGIEHVWVDTGDLAHRAANGAFHLDGRSDDLVQSGGVTVAPAALERVLQSHPEVAECAVVAVDDLELGQRLAAFVVTTRGSRIGGGALARWLDGQVARPLRPRWIRRIPALPLTAAQKIDRRALTRLALQRG